MARASKRAGFGQQRGAVSPRITYAEIAPNLPKDGDEWIKKSTSQKYVYDKSSTSWIPLFGAGGGGNLGGLVYHNDTNTTAVSTNLEVGTVDVTMAFDGSIVVTGTFVGTASAAMTLTTLIKLDTVTQHTIVDYVSGAVDHTVNFSVVLEGIVAGDYTVSVDMAASTGTFTLDASEQHLYCLTYYDTVIGGIGEVGATLAYSFGGFSTSQDTDEYNPNTDGWTEKTNMPFPPRYWLGASAIGFYGYVYCGYYTSMLQDCDEYSQVGDSWANKTNAPTPARRLLAASTIGLYGYIYGGQTNLQDTDEYSQSGDSWANKTNMPTPGRDGLGASTIGSSGYVYGGRNSATRTQDCDEYTPDTWTSKTNMPTPGRSGNSASTIGSSGYVYAGRDSVGVLQDCDEYTPDTWTSKTSVPTPARETTAASTVGLNGYIYQGSGANRDCDEYSQSGDSWANKTDAPLPLRTSPGGVSI